jgi:exonuclease-1
MESPPITPTSNQPKYYNSHRRRSLLSKDVVPFPEVLEQREHQIVQLHSTHTTTGEINPALVPLPEVDEQEMAELDCGATNENDNTYDLPGKGSEDLIIHDSEEDEPLSPVERGDGQQKLDLGRFIYAG